MRQTLITFVVEVIKSHADLLREDLKLESKKIPFADIPSLHFSSMFLTNAVGDEAVYFVWESNFDGPLKPYLKLAVALAEEPLKKFYAHCAGYAEGVDLFKFLWKYKYEPQSYHIGAPGLSARRVKAEQDLSVKLQGFLDEMDTTAVRYGDQAHEYLRRRAAEDPDLRWAETPEGRLSWLDRAGRWLDLALLTAETLAFTPVILVLAAVVRFIELVETGPDPVKTPNLNAVLNREDFGVQNHLADITRVKPGRGWILRIVLFSAWFTARVQTKGKLGGIPGIFFAHWSLIDGGKKLLFVSNYSGAWDSYLDDFIDIASWGLTPIWSNTVDFPRTRLLALGGSRNRSAFKRFVRGSQVESLVWHQAYPDLTVQNVNRNSKIRDGLFRQFDADGEQQWLRLF